MTLIINLDVYTPHNSDLFKGMSINDTTGYPEHRCNYCEQSELLLDDNVVNKYITDIRDRQ